MCGIVHVKRKDGKDAAKMVTKRFHKQRTRGTQGFGYIAMSDAHVLDYVRAADEKVILNELKNQRGNEIMFHHRYPTSTPNFMEAAHPIKVSHPSLKHDYYVVHNGVIIGDERLKEKHEALGFRYNTELIKKWRSNGNTVFQQSQWNDSEALAIELAIDLDKDQNGLMHIDGSIAFIALQIEKGSRKASNLFFGRNYNNPLRIVDNENYISICSEGGGESVSAHVLHTLNYSTNAITKKHYIVGEGMYDEQDARYGAGYQHHMGFRNAPSVTTGMTGRPYTKTDVAIMQQLKELEDSGAIARSEDPEGFEQFENASDVTDDEYMDACDEYATLQKKFMAEGTDQAADQAMLERLIELDAMIRQYETDNYGQVVNPNIKA